MALQFHSSFSVYRHTFILFSPLLLHFCNTMKIPRGRLTLPVITVIICCSALIALFYIDTTSFSSRSLFKFGTCSRKQSDAKISKFKKDVKKLVEDDDVVTEEADDRFEFDPNECSVSHGKWVFNVTNKPLYTDRTCPYIDRQFACTKNGRPDSDYRHWVWQPDDCVLPRFDPRRALEKLRGKRVMLVGDSLQRNQWESLVCLIESVIPDKHKLMTLGRSHSVFKIKKYNCTIEFYWAPFLVESNSDNPIERDPRKRILKVDSVVKHAKYWEDADILAFNTYVWWMSGTKVKSLWGSFPNGEQGYEELDTTTAYRIGLKTWANWVESNVVSNKTRVFFTTMSPTHSRSEDWDHKGGVKCYNETKPVTKRGYWGSGSNKKMMSVVADIVSKMKIPVTVINITQLSEYRKDGHASVYNELGGKLLTDEQRADPLQYADCIHWCLPGVPDTWNQILLAYL